MSKKVKLKKQGQSGLIQAPSGECVECVDVNGFGVVEVSPNDALIMRNCGWTNFKSKKDTQPSLLSDRMTVRETLEAMTEGDFWDRAREAATHYNFDLLENREEMTTRMLVAAGYETAPIAPSKEIDDIGNEVEEDPEESPENDSDEEAEEYDAESLASMSKQELLEFFEEDDQKKLAKKTVAELIALILEE